MSASTNFRKIFSKKNLMALFFNEIRYKSAIGIDNINRRSFEKHLEENINVIYKKAKKGTYKFSKYKEKLISKGRNKYPRIISIPTMRDKLVLKALFELLKMTFPDHSLFLHKIIDDVIYQYKMGCYDSFLRLDIKDFYPSIRHDILIKQTKKHIRKKEIIKLIENSISQITVDRPTKDRKNRNEVGVPQGLSISNILANLYLFSLDKIHGSVNSYIYFRFVDDILILCYSNEIEKIKQIIIDDCANLGLAVHKEKEDPHKMCCGDLKNGFEYLGYKFDNTLITVRSKSVEKLRESLIKQFTYYLYSKKKNIKMLEWTVNLKITGCIFNGTKYGWLFYFSQIEDTKLLHELDSFVKKLLLRFLPQPMDIKFKKFVKAFYEIKNNIKETKYILNFDKYTTSKKRQLLKDIFSVETKLMTSNEIEYQFNKRIYRSVKELEQDLARAS